MNGVTHSSFDGVFPKTRVLPDYCEDTGLDRTWPLAGLGFIERNSES